MSESISVSISVFLWSFYFSLSSCRLSSRQHVVQSGSLSRGCTLCVCAWYGRQAWPILLNAFIPTIPSPPPPSLCLWVPRRWLAVYLYACLSLHCVWWSFVCLSHFPSLPAFPSWKMQKGVVSHLHSRGCFKRYLRHTRSSQFFWPHCNIMHCFIIKSLTPPLTYTWL